MSRAFVCQHLCCNCVCVCVSLKIWLCFKRVPRIIIRCNLNRFHLHFEKVKESIGTYHAIFILKHCPPALEWFLLVGRIFQNDFLPPGGLNWDSFCSINQEVLSYHDGWFRIESNKIDWIIPNGFQFRAQRVEASMLWRFLAVTSGCEFSQNTLTAEMATECYLLNVWFKNSIQLFIYVNRKRLSLWISPFVWLRQLFHYPYPF